MLFGFDINKDGYQEIIPEIFSKFSRVQKRKIFITQYNAYVEDDLKIRPSLTHSKRNLKYLFHQKIDELLHVKSADLKEKSFTCKPLCPISNVIINLYLNGKYEDIKRYCTKVPSHPAAKLISMLYAKDSKGLCFDANMMFSQYVFDKIKRRNRDKKVYFEDEIIVIEQNGQKVLGILPCFKHIEEESIKTDAKNEINNGFCTLAKSQVEKLFIVFPRNEQFRRHVAVRESNLSQSDTRLKLVPYSISNKIVRR